MGVGEETQDSTGLDAFLHRLEELGWRERNNVEIIVRWSNSNLGLMRSQASELVALKPDVILCLSNPALAQLRPLAGNIPIVFVMVADPVGSGFVASLARPGGNVTGFTNFEPSMGGKWVEILKELAPSVTRVGVLMHPEPRHTRRFGGKPKWPQAALVSKQRPPASTTPPRPSRRLKRCPISR
ncbi:MAG: ABC transporter substrate-binding protein [Alphaproteobacteria bacterium]|nr:ABC transporter substrate-binding protein [Alphaproteobacteria bacterium]